MQSDVVQDDAKRMSLIFLNLLLPQDEIARRILVIQDQGDRP